MPLVGDFVPVEATDDNADFHRSVQLREITGTLQKLSLTRTQDVAIANNDQAGNLDSVYVVFTSNGVANTEDTVAHTLGRTPVGFIPVSQDKSASLYKGSTAWTSTNVYFKTSVATVAWTVLLI